MVCMCVFPAPPHQARPRRVLCDPSQTSRRLVDLEPDTPYVISLAARTTAGVGPVLTAEDRTLEESGTRPRYTTGLPWLNFVKLLQTG